MIGCHAANICNQLWASGELKEASALRCSKENLTYSASSYRQRFCADHCIVRLVSAFVTRCMHYGFVQRRVGGVGCNVLARRSAITQSGFLIESFLVRVLRCTMFFCPNTRVCCPRAFLSWLTDIPVFLTLLDDRKCRQISSVWTQGVVPDYSL